MNISISYIINKIFRQDSAAEAVELWNLPARSCAIIKNQKAGRPAATRHGSQNFQSQHKTAPGTVLTV